MKEWQFNVLFFVGVGGAILLLIGPEFGLNFSQNPTALAGVGSILTYILTQRKSRKNGTERETRKRRSIRSVYDRDEDEGEEDGHEH